MGLHYYEEAAIAGHPDARFDLACYVMVDGRIDRAVKHWIIAANLGDDDSIQTLKGCYARGEVSKEEFAAALRAHYAAVDATKSPQREAAEAEEGVKCQEEHRPQHEAMCKERAAELRNEILFRQPENSHLGDCPICVLPLSNDQDEFSLQSCCSKIICNGCGFANLKRQQEKSLDFTCPFCRQKMSESVEVGNMNLMKRAKANDPVSTREMGVKHYNDGDFEGAIEYYTKAAELGNAEAHYDLSVLYREGKGVEKDEGKELYHLEEAAIAGHPDARYNIGLYETMNRRFDRAVNHWIIAANLGHGDSIQKLKKCYTHGLVSKEGFAAALRAHQAAPKTPEELDKNIMKRAAANDAFAIRQMGMKCYREGDYEGSFKYLSNAVELGDVGAHHVLGALYLEGKGVKKDYGKAIYCYERAAIGGHPAARYNLGLDEGENGRFERAVKHFIIAATLGNDDSIQRLKHCYTIGKVSKTDFAAALQDLHPPMHGSISSSSSGNAGNNMVADETEAADICCASCGIAEVDEIKLTKCDGCDLVRYCSDKCQQDHRPQHDAMCKERAAELRDEILFRQPDGSYLGDCPICCLPLSLDIQRAMLHTCCSKWICDGCAFANKLREIEARLQQTCPFCRHPPPATLEEVNKNDMKRAAANDPVAMRQLGTRRYLEGDYVGAFEYCTKAAELGDGIINYRICIWRGKVLRRMKK
ncbi:Sel1-like repeat family protein [Skeletonema marinoi]|uniref:Sel1-like repeat family protein n=1 Tax=Skeletonema marinoi TaxID=267567 RepID=A0AAD9D6R4_9STRA|nr:Sel1-like repeat family protein [Skeletonema marinoi]